MSIPFAFALLAMAAPDARHAAPADNAFGRCLAEAGSMLGDARCYGAEQERLEAEQKMLLKRLSDRLRRPGPPETRYPAALAALNRAQTAWLVYQNADCEIVDGVFGEGNAKGLAGATCTIDHYTARNAVLRDLLKEYLTDD